MSQSNILGIGGAKQDRTADLLRARQALSQLSYSPKHLIKELVGLSGLEPPTSPLSGVRSNQLSYKPEGFPQARERKSIPVFRGPPSLRI